LTTPTSVSTALFVRSSSLRRRRLFSLLLCAALLSASFAMVLIHVTKSTEEFIYDTKTTASVDVVTR
jgi:cytochrome c-type biogenesis protein CcmE